MAVLWFDLFLVGWVLLMLAVLVWGGYRGDFSRRHAHVFAGMFLTFLPMLASNLVGSGGLTGRALTAARALLLTVGLAGLAIALRGLRTNESEDDDDDGSDGPRERTTGEPEV